MAPYSGRVLFLAPARDFAAGRVLRRPIRCSANLNPLMRKLPPHIVWPLCIVLFLLGGMASAFRVVIASRTDGGVAVVENYYDKALHWDEEATARAASAALRWQAQIVIEALPGAEQHRVQVVLRDAEGRPVEGLQVHLQAQRPFQAEPAVDAVLAPTGEAGVYAHAAPRWALGLWDLDLVATRGAERFQLAQRVEVTTRSVSLVGGGRR